MNSAFMTEQARRFAESVLAPPNLTEPERLRRAYLRAIQRSPRPEETARVQQFLNAYAARLASVEQDTNKRTLRAWQAFCQTLLASNEFLHAD
jgi:uncharacterized protein with PIN domain